LGGTMDLDRGKKAMTFELLKKLSILFGINIVTERLMLYAEELNKYEWYKIKFAIEQCKYNLKYFPTISELINLMEPKIEILDEANDLAGNAVKILFSNGRYQVAKSIDEMDHRAYLALDMLGGPYQLFDLAPSDLSSFRAQLRDAVKSLLNKESKINYNNLIEFNRQECIDLKIY
jgi:hypothetical protein